MPQLNFTGVHDYSGDGESILIPVVLRSGMNMVRIATSVDTGATYCVFSSEIAEALGLELTNGIPQPFRTVNGQFETHGHEVELEVLGVVMRSVVYFFADDAIDKNVLGRIGWLDRVRLGIVHHDSKIYVAAYDTGE